MRRVAVAKSTGVKNGDITPISIIKGSVDWTTKTVKDIYDWSYKLSPFVDISDE